MALRIASIALGLLHIAAAMPALTLQDMEMADDTMAIGSYIRETRAAPQQEDNYHKSYESEGDGEIGYSRKKTGGGKKGYQQFNAYHKKAGDHYEFEKQDSYGLEDEKQAGAHSHNHETREKYREPEQENLDEKREQKAEKQEKEEADEDHEEIKEGDSDGNGGIEAQGHDPADYILPERYTYGSGETYNF